MADTSLLAVFARSEDLTAALPAVEGEGLPFQVFSPTRDEGVQKALGMPRSPVRFVTLAGFLCGAGCGLLLCVFAATRWNFIVSGKPVLAWVPFTVIAFELSILLGVLFTFGGMVFLSRLVRGRPAPCDPRFTGDRFGLLVRGAPAGGPLEARLRAAGAEDVRELRG